MSTNVLTRLTNEGFSRLPAVPDREAAEPREPSEWSREIEPRGRSPEEVLGDRWNRQPAEYTSDEVSEAVEKARKYEQLEVAAARQAQQQAAQPAVITNSAIAKAYGPVAAEIENDLLANDLVDEDLVEAYNKTFRTMVGQMRFLADKIFDNEAKLHTVINRFEQTLAWLNAFKSNLEAYVAAAQRQGQDPFTGASGKLLSKLIKSSGRMRE